MVSFGGFSERLTAGVFLQWYEAFSVKIDRAAFAELEGRALADAIKAFHAQLDQTIRDQMHSDFHRAARVADPKLTLAFWAAIGSDTKLVESLEALACAEDRALWLLAKMPGSFERAEIVTAFADHGQRRWRGYHLTKDFSRAWTPEEVTQTALSKIATKAIQEVEGATREIEVEMFEVSGVGKDWKGGQSFYFVIHVPDRTERAGEWLAKRRITRFRTPDRRIDLVISPHAKTLEVVGGSGISAKLLETIVDRFAAEVLQQSKPLDPFKRRKFYLGGLRKRPSFPTHREHGIGSVTVTKLVVGSGAGTVTYWAPVRKKSDVYDVIASSPGRSIGGRPVVAATIRIVFDPAAGSRKERRLALDITMPNSSSLREEQPLDQLIIGTYLREWGLLDPDEEEHTDQGALQELVQLMQIPARVAVMQEEAEQRFGSYLPWICSTGILEQTAEPASLLCCTCSPPHPVAPLEGIPGGALRFVCTVAGDLVPTKAEFKSFAISRGAIAKALCAVLKADASIFNEIRESSLWCLGVVAEPRPWTAFLGFDLTDKDVFRDVLEALGGPLGKEPGLLITVSELPNQIQLPNGHRLTSINEILRLTPQGLVTLPGIGRALAGKSPAKKRGPKNRKNEALNLLRSRRLHNLALHDPDAETRQIISMLKATHDQDVPQFKEVRYVWFAEQFG